MDQINKILKKISVALGLPIFYLVKLYQRTVSPDHGLLKDAYPLGYCRFYPSCSSYALQALKKDGIISLPKIVWRVFRCQPWSLGGFDYYNSIFKHKH